MSIATDQSGTANVIITSPTGLTLNEWNTINIRRFLSGSTYSYEVRLNGIMFHSESDMTNDQSFTDVKVYAANPAAWDGTAEGSMRNLLIRTPFTVSQG